MIRVSLGVTAGFRFRVWGLDSGLPVTGKFRVLSLSSRIFFWDEGEVQSLGYIVLSLVRRRQFRVQGFTD